MAERLSGVVMIILGLFIWMLNTAPDGPQTMIGNIAGAMGMVCGSFLAIVPNK